MLDFKNMSTTCSSVGSKHFISSSPQGLNPSVRKNILLISNKNNILNL